MTAQEQVTFAHPAARIAVELARDFDGRLPAETVERCVSESYTELAHSARITAFLPILAKRSAKQRLRELSLAGVAGTG